MKRVRVLFAFLICIGFLTIGSGASAQSQFDLDGNTVLDATDVKIMIDVVQETRACPISSCDLNGDKVIDITDLQLLIIQVNGSQLVPIIYDLDGSGKIDSMDVNFLDHVILGLVACTVPTCDFNQDGTVDKLDSLLLVGQIPVYTPPVVTYDLDGNGTVDITDVKIMSEVVFGQSACPVATCELNGSDPIDILDIQLLITKISGTQQVVIIYDLDGNGIVDDADLVVLTNVIIGASTCPVATCDLNSDGDVDVLDSQVLINKIPASQPPAIIYDLDGDGAVTPSDVKIITEVVMGGITCPVATCDLNNDGDLNVLDIQLLASMVPLINPVVVVYDLDGNGQVDLTDANIMVEVIVGSKSCPVATCDLNGDGAVNILDSQLLSNQIPPAPPATITYDLDGSGVVDLADLQVLNDVIFGTIPCPVATCDLNSDGAVNILDIQLLAGMISVINTPVVTYDIDGNNDLNLTDAKLLGDIIRGIRVCPIRNCDLNGDKLVDILDLQLLLNQIGGTGSVVVVYDLDFNGVVDLADVQILDDVILGTITCPVATCDLNGDGAVNILDSQFLIVLISAAPPAGSIYDLNGDGTVDNGDVTTLVNVILGIDTCPVANCDLNGDGNVDILDSLLLAGSVTGTPGATPGTPGGGTPVGGTPGGGTPVGGTPGGGGGGSSGSPTSNPQYQQVVNRISALGYQMTAHEIAVVARERLRAGVVDNNLVERLIGKILLQVEEHGEAWYMDGITWLRYYLADGDSAYQALRVFGLGITNADLAQIPIGVDSRLVINDTDGDTLSDQLEIGIGTDPNNTDSDGDGFDDGAEVTSGYDPLGPGAMSFTNINERLEGRILLQVEDHGEAWYVHNGKRYYMKDGAQAYQIMRFLSLGITNNDLNKIGVGEL